MSTVSTRTLSLLSQKGGSGKTTLATHLAVAPGGARRVVLVDTDPQRSAAAWARARQASFPQLVEATAGRIVAALRTIRAASPVPGLVVIDSMPSVESDISSIARASDFVLIPCRPSILDLRAIGGTVKLIKEARIAVAIVLNAVPPPRFFGQASPRTTEARRALAQYGLPVVQAAIGYRTALADALAAGLAVEEFEPSSQAEGNPRPGAHCGEAIMARRPGRPSLAAVDLTSGADNPKAPETERNTQAQTLRLPPRYWRYLQVKAVQRKTTQSALIKQALDDMMKRDPQPPGFE